MSESPWNHESAASLMQTPRAPRVPDGSVASCGRPVARDQSDVGLDVNPPKGTRLARALRRSCSAALALSMITVGLPIYLALGLLILVVDGRPVFYRGTRLGKGKRLYTMYKFRTLARGASRVIGSELVSTTDRLTIRCGQFLRDTRLDELPQLWNIVKGDMSFVGPRPERPEVYESQCRDMDGYDWRFSVKPGLIGYSQLFTPHGSPKRLRSLADGLFMRSPATLTQEAMFVGFSVFSVLETVTARLARAAYRDVFRARVLRRQPDRRQWRRRRVDDVLVHVETQRGDTFDGVAIDINEKALLVEVSRSAADLDPLEGSFGAIRESEPENGAVQLELKVRFRRRRFGAVERKHVIRCSGRPALCRSTDGRRCYVFEYEASTPWHQYLIDQYLLRISLGRPFR